jgi:hypothetical protein
VQPKRQNLGAVWSSERKSFWLRGCTPWVKLPLYWPWA